MSDFAVKVDSLSKLYQIGKNRRGSLRETLIHSWQQLKGSKKNNLLTEDFWALKDVSFEINRGEAVGIIGKNGAGKSTLLKILSRITQPTRGRVEICGRIASLLEVGTGFHPELSGRENVYLNGTILGMKRREIKAKFDEIVSFSGVEKFIDTPVKHYSSGMYVRLAFAVAAHLEPEILIIDEVLAVGDAEFQKKCLGKMGEVAGQGRTVIFVSHNMAAVKTLCKSAILLKKGQIIQYGLAKDVADYYLQNMAESACEFILPVPDKKNLPGFAQKVIIEDEFGNPSKSLPLGRPYQIRIKFTLLEKVPHFVIGMGCTTVDDYPVRTVWSQPQDMEQGHYEVVFSEEKVYYTSGRYKLIIGLSSREQSFHYVEDMVFCEFEEYADKKISLKSNSGLVLNQMKVSFSKLTSIIPKEHVNN